MVQRPISRQSSRRPSKSWISSGWSCAQLLCRPHEMTYEKLLRKHGPRKNDARGRKFRILISRGKMAGMSGHNKWAQIKRQKEKNDGAKSNIWDKLGKRIAVE